MENDGSKHFKREDLGSRHAKRVSKKPKILKAIIATELVLAAAACFYIYVTWCGIIEARFFEQFWSSSLADASVLMDDNVSQTVKTSLESVVEEVYEYAWITEKIEYRTGADMSYESAGTLDKDKMVKRTGITLNGWSRITVDDEEYYVPKDSVSTDIPDWLPIASGIKGEYQKYALSLLPDFGWDTAELEPLIYLWNRESGWNPNSHNKSSGAHGIPQALPASKMASEGSDYYTNAEPQIRWGLKYIARRYGSPSAAWRHFQSKGWY